MICSTVWTRRSGPGCWWPGRAGNLASSLPTRRSVRVFSAGCRSCAGSACTGASPTPSHGFPPGASRTLSAPLPPTRRSPSPGGGRRSEARRRIPNHPHVDFDPNARPQATENANRALAIARELADEDLEGDALRAAHRMGSFTVHREGIERIAAALERRGDLIALNEHLFDSMWTYWRAAQFIDCVACCELATPLAHRLGIPPVQYGTITSFALLDLGRFDEAWHGFGPEVGHDEHPCSPALEHLERRLW